MFLSSSDEGEIKKKEKERKKKNFLREFKLSFIDSLIDECFFGEMFVFFAGKHYYLAGSSFSLRMMIVV